MAKSGMIPGLSQEYTDLVDQLRDTQTFLSKLINAQNQLETQLNENNMVKEELSNEPPAVYKLSGRVLVKQDLTEAQSTVARRIEFITAEVKRSEKSIKETQEKLMDVRTKLQAAQKQQVVT